MQREVYFHIRRRDEVKVIEASENEKLLSPLRKPELAYFKSECTRVLLKYRVITMWMEISYSHIYVCFHKSENFTKLANETFV